MSTQTLSPQNAKLAGSRLAWVGPLAIVAAVAANLVWYGIASALFPVSLGKAAEILNPFTIIGSSIGFLLIGLFALVVVNRVSRQPVRTYRIIAVVGLVLSLSNPIMAAAGFMPLPGGAVLDGTVVGVMLVMHVIAAAVFVPMVTSLAQQK
jgi:hypothetical protein